MTTKRKEINPLDISFKEFMPGQIIQSTQFNDDMNDIEEKVNELIDDHNVVSKDLYTHIADKDNPHSVDAHQTGTYYAEEIDEFIQDVKSGNLYDNAITNRVLDDDCVDNRNIIDGSITNSKLDSSIGSQIDISQNISITDRYTKEETDLLIQEKVGDGTYDKETIDEKLEQIQAGQILDKSINIHQLKDDVGRRLDISNNPDIINKYTREEVDLLIRNNALPRDWGSILEEDNDIPVVIPTKEITLPVANHMKVNTCTVSESSILDIDIQENVDARGEFNTVGERLNNFDSQIKDIAKREYISLDAFGDTQQAYQECFDYCNENGIGILIPSKTFYINEPIILREQGTYYIKGCNTNMNDGSNVKSKSVLIPKTILFKGELIDDNTTVYITMENVRIMPEKGADGYTKDGTYVFYNLNMFGLTLNNVTCRYIDVFSQGYISKASVIRNTRVSFIKTALFKGNEFNGAFMADSQISDCYFTGGYPVTLLHGTVVNTTISNCFFDFFKHMISFEGNKKCDGLHFKDNTIGMFFRWFKENRCNGHMEIIGNKIEGCAYDVIQNYKSTNFAYIDSDMNSEPYGVFYATSWQDNIDSNPNDKCLVHGNRFVTCDNVFTKSNSIAQVDIRNNHHTGISGIAYELSYRKDSLGESASFYCDYLDGKVVNELPIISASGEYYVFNGQRCFLNKREYVLIDYKWVEIANNNIYSPSATPTYCGTYDGKPLYKRLMKGSITLNNTGFKTPINIPDAEIVFVDLTHSYWNEQGSTLKMGFNYPIKTAVVDKTINLLPYDGKRVLMYQDENASTPLNIDYVIAIEYTLS